jgi:hypothetical protein
MRGLKLCKRALQVIYTAAQFPRSQCASQQNADSPSSANSLQTAPATCVRLQPVAAPCAAKKCNALQHCRKFRALHGPCRVQQQPEVLVPAGAASWVEAQRRGQGKPRCLKESINNGTSAAIAEGNTA